ncbi:MAG: cell wall hydrolase [Kiloniellaceae bacterium]
MPGTPPAGNADKGTAVTPDPGNRGIAAWTGLLGLAGCLILAAPARAEVDVRQEVECLALTIYFEARGEPDAGKLAVGHVVMNRAAHPLFPKAVCAVVWQSGEKLRDRCQFSWWCDGRSDRPGDWRAWTRSKALARRVYWDYSTDPTGGALWYHADHVMPDWRKLLAPGPKIGRHIFYRPHGDDHRDDGPLRRPARYRSD